MNRKYLLLSIGVLMLMSWVWIFGISTFTFVSQILNDEPYYFDNTFLYFFAFALAPFVLNSYIDGVHLDEVMSQKRKILHKVNLVLLSFFALMLCSLSIATYFAFFDTFWDEKLSVQFLILLIPIILTLMFLAHMFLVVLHHSPI